MTRPDPVLEKWLQEQERKLIRAQTDLVRFQQQPRRGSAGEALLFDATDILVKPFDPTTGLNDWPMYNAPPSWSVRIDEVFPHTNSTTGYSFGGVSVEEMRQFNGTHVLTRIANGISINEDTIGDTQLSDQVAVWRLNLGFDIPTICADCNTSFVELLIHYYCDGYPPDCGSGVMGSVSGIGNCGKTTAMIQYIVSFGFTNSDGTSPPFERTIRQSNIYTGADTLPLMMGKSAVETDTGGSRCYNYTSRQSVFCKNNAISWGSPGGVPLGNETTSLVYY